jgi:mannose-6-phosphate isomerase-like protein (cupin superfamily)
MTMRRLLAILWLAAAPAATQTPPTVGPIATAAEVDALVAKAEREIKPGENRLLQPLVRLAPYTALLEYRRGGTPPNAHRKDAELIYVLRGTGTLVLGGALTGVNPNASGDPVGTGVNGGKTYKVKPGDIFLIAENEPHWFQATDGVVIDLALHVPRPAASWP